MMYEPSLDNPVCCPRCQLWVYGKASDHLCPARSAAEGMMSEHTPGPWIEGEQINGPLAFECGCKVTREYRTFRGRDQRRGVIDYCPIHAAAPRLLQALKVAEDTLRDLAERAGDDPEWNRGGNGYVAFMAARAAIREAEGGE